MTPTTMQRTTFYKNRIPQTRPVMKGQPANIHDRNGWGFHHQLQLLIFSFKNEAVLHLFGKIDKTNIPAAETNLQILIFFGMPLGLVQIIGRKNIEMNKKSPLGKKASNQTADQFDSRTSTDRA